MLSKLYSWYGKRTVLIAIALIVVLVVTGIVIKSQSDSEIEEKAVLRTVEVASARSLSGQSSFSLIGSVESRNQADITTETSGRVTRVNVTVGQTVSAGTILFEIENSAQRATVLQAQGSYEAALAGAQQSNVSQADAENTLLTARNNGIASYRSAYNTTNDILLNTIDTFFTDPYGQVPGVRIDSQGNSQYLNSTRVGLNPTMQNWQQSSRTLSTEDDIQVTLTNQITDVQTIIDVLDILIAATAEADKTDMLNGQTVNSFTPVLSGARERAVGIIVSLQNSATAIQGAKENLQRATIGGTSGEVSAANAQVKQALGVLRSAESNLAKTIVRTPISGTLNEFSVKTGDFVGIQNRVALVANNDALEITVFVGEADRNRLAVGDVVVIDKNTTGFVTAIAPAVDSETKKFEVKIAAESDNITNGDTVTITVQDDQPQNTDGPLLLPITAIKFTDVDGVVFTVEGTTLVEHSVRLGTIQGSFVEVTEGITPNMNVVIDARGLSAGQQVEAVSIQ